MSEKLLLPPDRTLIDVHIRWMVRRDMAEVLEIERESFGEFPWDEGDFLMALRQRNCIGMVCSDNPGGGGRIFGYMIYELHRKRIHVVNFAVAAQCRRLGVGRQMVEKLKEKLSVQRRGRLMLNVREGNLAGQLFFRECGFRAVAVLIGFYGEEETLEDAYLMEFRWEGMRGGGGL